MHLLQLLVCLVLAAVALPASAADESPAPTSLALYIGGYGSARYHVDLVDGALRYRVEVRGKQTEEVVKPTAERWVAFQLALDELKVWAFKPLYEIPSEDGTQWSVKITSGDRRVESFGNNAYPPQFKAYLAAVRALLGGKAFD